MRKLQSPRAKALVILCLAMMIAASVYAVFAIRENARYSDPGFQSYLQKARYCNRFMGGTVLRSDYPAYYKDWQAKEPLTC